MIYQVLAALDRIERLPEWARPLAYGPMLVLGMMAWRGAFVLGPIFLVVLAWNSPAPSEFLVAASGILLLALTGSVVGGAVYALIGRRAKRIPFAGPYLAGMIAVAPYLMVVMVIIRLTEGLGVWFWPTGAELLVLTILTGFYGLLFGHMFLRPGALL